jgi:hypothetical protein
MSILGPSENDGFEAASLAAIDAAARTDWRAAAWRLAHSPETRERYSDFDRNQALGKQWFEACMKAWDRLGLSADLKLTFILALQAEYLPVAGEEP